MTAAVIAPPPVAPLPIAFTHPLAGMFYGNPDRAQSDGLAKLLQGTTGFSLRQRAYILATAYHETGRRMQPIAEVGEGEGRPYGEPVNGQVYFGRGFVQLTWRYNYARFGAPGVITPAGINLIGAPDLALTWPVALPILTTGMRCGMFTGKKLSDYFSSSGLADDPVGARRIVNGNDRAELISTYYETFTVALIALGRVYPLL